jgi:hypothetical protein
MQDLLKTAPAIAAVIMSVLAVIPVIYPPQRQWVKAAFTLGIVLFGAIAVVTTFWAQRIESDQRIADQARQRDIRGQLGKFIAQGEDLMNRCANENQRTPIKEANAWEARTEAFLRGQLGPGYVYRFRSDAGLPLTATSIQSIDHRNLWGWIRSHTARLEQFSEEASWQ